MNLERECAKCAVSATCPSRGSSPLIFNNHRIACRIVGGFGRVPVDRSVLSEESKAVSDKNGPCLTVAEVPRVDDGRIVFDVVKIFSPPILLDREKQPVTTVSDLSERSHK